MKYLWQFAVILAVSFAGEGLHAALPLPVPAGIYGMALLFALLATGLLPAARVRETGAFLIEIMPLLFIPAAVGLLESWGLLRPLLVPYLVITAVSTAAVMAVSGRVTQAVCRRTRAGREQ